MTIRLYFGEDAMWQTLVTALRARGIDVQTALEAAMIGRADEDHLAFATAQDRAEFLSAWGETRGKQVR